MVYEFDGTKYEKLRDMQAARRAKHRAWCAAARTSPAPPTRPASINAPGRSGATAGHAPPAATSGRSRTGAVATWTNPDGPTPDTCAWTSASPSPTCTAPAAASAPSPGPRQGAQHQREHQRLAAPVLPQGNRPVRIHRGTPRRSRHGTQREDPRTDRRHRNINTNRHQQHQLSTKMLRRPLESANDIQQTPQPNAGVDRVFRTHDPAL